MTLGAPSNEDKPGLKAIGTAYVAFSLIASATLIVTAISEPNPLAPWQISGAIGQILQGLLVKAVLSWMATIAAETAAARNR